MSVQCLVRHEMSFPTLFLTLVSCFCLVAVAFPAPVKEENVPRSVSIQIIPDDLEYELLNYPERAKVQLYKILSLHDPYKKASLLVRWTKLYKTGQSSKLNLDSLLRYLSGGKREKYLKTVEYEYGRPVQVPQKAKVKYSRKVKHFDKPRLGDDFLTLLASQRVGKQFSSSSKFDIDLGFDVENNIGTDEDESLDGEDSEDVDGGNDHDLDVDASDLLESAEASGSEELKTADLTSAENAPVFGQQSFVIADERSHSAPVAVSSLPHGSLPSPTPHIPDWRTEGNDDLGLNEFPRPQEEIDTSLETSKQKQLKYYELWKLIHPECRSLECVPPELWPVAGLSLDISHKKLAGLVPASNSCRYLAKLMITLWKKMSVYLGSLGNNVPPSPDLKKIFYLIHLYLKLNQEHNLSEQPIKVITYYMYRILSQYPNMEFPEFPVDFPTDPNDVPIIDFPVEDLVEVPFEYLVEDPVEDLVEVPVEYPVEVPVEDPVKVPVEDPVEVPVEYSVEVPVEFPVEFPVEYPDSHENIDVEVEDHHHHQTSAQIDKGPAPKDHHSVLQTEKESPEPNSPAVHQNIIARLCKAVQESLPQ